MLLLLLLLLLPSLLSAVAAVAVTCRCLQPQGNLIAGCGIHKAPCFWKNPNFYKQVLLVLCVIIKCYIHSGATYGLYSTLNQMVQREPVLACDLDDRQHMSLVNGSIEKCCGVNTGYYSIPARGKDYQGLQQPQHSWLPGTLTLQQPPGTLRLQVSTDNSHSSDSRKQEGQQQRQQQQQHIPALPARHGKHHQGIQQPRHSWLPDTLTLQQTLGTLTLQALSLIHI